MSFFSATNLLLLSCLLVLSSDFILRRIGSEASLHPVRQFEIGGLKRPVLTNAECDSQGRIPEIEVRVRLSQIKAYGFSTLETNFNCDGHVQSQRSQRENFLQQPFAVDEKNNITPIVTSISELFREGGTFFELLHFKGTCGEEKEPFCLNAFVWDDTRPDELRKWIKDLDRGNFCFVHHQTPPVFKDYEDTVRPFFQSYKTVRADYLKNLESEGDFVKLMNLEVVLQALMRLQNEKEV